MRRYLTIFVLSLLWFINWATAHSDNPLNFQFPETVSERNKFLMYLDSIDKYLYRDAFLTQKIIQECEIIVNTSDVLTNEDRLNFATQKIYIEQNNTQYLECYKIVKTNEHYLQDNTISKEAKDNFNYIRAYTYLSLEDIAAAQKAFYQIIEKGRMEKDTAQIYKGLFSLGQLYGDQKEYKSSIECFLELAEIGKYFFIRPTSFALLNYELAETYSNLENYEQAKVFIEKGLAVLEAEKVNRLKPDFLLQQGRIALAQQNIKKAVEISHNAYQLSLDLNDLYSLERSRLFQAEVLAKQNKLQQAIDIYETLIAEMNTTSLQANSLVYNKAQAILFEIGDYQKAYTYLKRQRSLENEIELKEKKAQSAYLKVKYESAEKERENQQLTMKILQEENRNRLLYLLSALFFLGIIILFVAFYQKRIYNRRLRAEVKERTLELESSNKNLAQSNEELERFAYITSHDLKTPLTNIVNFAGLLEHKLTAYNDDELFTYLKFIKKGGKRMNELINDTLKFSSVSRLDQEKEFINLEQFINELKASMFGLITTRKAKVIVQNPLPNIKAHRFSINLLFQNLIENGIKYNESVTPTVTICAKQSPSYHSIFIEDNGVGIAEKYYNKIFVMYSRLHNHNKYTGTGLGLSICKKIVTQLNGEILVQSKANKGSTFEIRLPKDSSVYT